MVEAHRIFVNTVVILLFIQTNSYAKKSQKHQCPIGFQVAYSKHKEDPICYRLKGPESFSDSFADCAGNLYTTKLYYSYNITRTELKLWTEYKNLYPGGPFVDWSYTASTGELLLTTAEVNYERYLGVDEDLCVAIDPVTNFTAVSCDEKYHRYCFVKPYSEEDVTIKGCEKFKGSMRFSSPWPTCLAAVSAVGGGAVRATWRQAEELCEKRGGSLLSKGWRYSNNPYFETSGAYPMYPLSVVFNPNQKELRFDAGNRNSVINPSDWNFEDNNFSSDTTLGAVRDHFWYLVNSSFIFYDVFCEKPIELKSVSMTVSVDEENKIILTVSEPVDESDIYCFTDSVIYYPLAIKFTYDEISNIFILRPREDGYYWCTHIDSKNYRISESNKQLFIREKQSTMNVYSVKLRMKNKYKFDSLDKFYKSWEKKLTEYIFYRTKYTKVYGDPFSDKDFRDTTTVEQELKNFKSSFPSVNLKDRDIIRNAKIQRLYLDSKTALVHVEINADMMPVPPGKWDDLEVIFMKPAYYCPETDAIPTMPLGSSVVTTGCVNYTCIGDFNEGVQWVGSETLGCEMRPDHVTSITSSVGLTRKVTMVMPTVESILISEIPIAVKLMFPDKYRVTEYFKLEHKAYSRVNVHVEYNDRVVPCREGVPNVDICVQVLYKKDTRDLALRDHEDSSDESTEHPRPSQTTTTSTEPSTDTLTDPTVEVNSTIITPNPPNVTSDVTYFRPPKPPTIILPPLTKPTVLPTTTTPMPSVRPSPEEQLQQVMEDLEFLLNNDSEPVLLENINRAFDQVDELLSDSEELHIPGELLHLLDGIGARMELNGSDDAVAVRENIALLVADANPELPVNGLRIAARDTDIFTDNAFEIVREPVNSSHLQTGESEVVVQLPGSIAVSQRRISFVVFRTDRAFQNSIGHYTVNSRVLSINVENLTQFDDGEVIDIHLTPMRDTPERNQSRACAYWHFLENSTGYWSTEGCTFIQSTEEGVLDTCRCDHLTHFAEILIPRTSFSETHEAILQLITIIGCCMSILGLMLVGLTAILFRSWRRDFSNKIWLQLCLAILVLVSCFLLVTLSNFDEYSTVCMLIGVLLHYSTLASFCWMVVAAILSYRRLVMVFTRDASHKLLKASAFSWGAPCAVVGILLSVAPQSYAGQFEGDVPPGAFCYPSGLGLWLAVYAPIALMLVTNWTLFALIVRSVFASRRIQRHGDSNEALRCASVSCLLVFLFGLPWIFGLFLATNLVTVYLFTITVTLQGFMLFVFFVLGNKKTRDLWLNKLKIKQTRKIPVTSSTYTNRSTGNPAWRVGSAGSTSMEGKASKPRSLASADDSRFS